MGEGSEDFLRHFVGHFTCFNLFNPRDNSWGAYMLLSPFFKGTI